jgi:hypothetical protein
LTDSSWVGRSNQGEFKFVMDKVIWHAPDIKETGLDLSAIYRHKILCNILVKDREAFTDDLEKLMTDDYFEDDELHLKQYIIDNMVLLDFFFFFFFFFFFHSIDSFVDIQVEPTGKAKIVFIKYYIKYIFESFWKQKIVILYRHNKVFQEMEKVLNSNSVSWSVHS